MIFGTSGTAFTESITVYAQWEKNEATEPVPEVITVTLDGAGGTFDDNKSSVTLTADESGKAVISAYPVRDGYNFRGFNTKPDGSGETISYEAVITVAENTTIYAIWERKTVTVLFQANGGAFAGDKTMASVKVYIGGILTEIQTPTRAGYIFKGYNTKADGSGDTVVIGEGGTVFNKGATLYAQWEEEQSEPEVITVTLDGAGGLFDGEKTTVTLTADENGKVVISAYPVRENYNFKGFNTKQDGSGETIAYEDEKTFAENTTIYAIWQRKTVTILFQANGGTFAGDKAMVSAKIDMGGVLTETQTPTREGYIFRGYNTKADGSGDTVVVGEGGTVFGKGATLYAQWEEE